MARKRHAPLTPADSKYVGIDSEGWHMLVWPSQTRAYHSHNTFIHRDGGLSCTCEAFTHRGCCKHAAAAKDALLYHLDPPPADPGGAAPTAAQADLDGETGDWILGGKLSPPPWLVAPRERRRRHDEGMATLYGDDWRQR
jgi:hypothetical protein